MIFGNNNKIIDASNNTPNFVAYQIGFNFGALVRLERSIHRSVHRSVPFVALDSGIALSWHWTAELTQKVYG